MNSHDVQIWDIRKREDRARSRPYRVRWSVAGNRFEEYFRTKALADSFRSKLVRAANDGEAFDTVTGKPRSMLRAELATTWYGHARAYVEMKWPHAAPKYRRSIVEALVTVTVALVKPLARKPDPEVLRRALYLYGLNPKRWQDEPPKPEADALAWIQRASQSMVELAEGSVVRRALDACALRLDRRPCSATVMRRKRAVFSNALAYAVEAGVLDANPLDKVKWKATGVAATVDRRVVANPGQVASLLDALGELGPRGERLVAFFACLYYAGMRPSEAAEIRLSDCELPASGWGIVVLAETDPRAAGTGRTTERLGSGAV